MRKISCLPFWLTLVAVALFVSPAYAATIGVNFSAEFGSIASTDPAGVVPKINWNNFNAVQTAAPIKNDSGANTSVLVSTNRTNYSSIAPTGGTNGDKALMSGGQRSTAPSSGQTVSVLLQNINSAISGPYDAYVYFSTHGLSFIWGQGTVYASNNAGDFGGNVIPGSFLDSQNWSLPGVSPFTGTFIQGTNYVKFTGLTEDTLVLTAYVTGGPSGGDFNNSRVSGVQLVGADAPAVPEPSTYALGLIGLAGLGVVAWRRRRQS